MTTPVVQTTSSTWDVRNSLTIASMATSTKVVEAWLKTLLVVEPAMVGPSLPSDPAVWAATGFWQVSVIGGTPSTDLAELFNPVVEVSCWAASPNSEHPPYNRAEAMCTAVRNEAQKARCQDLSVGVQTVRLLGLASRTEPRRLPDVATGFARAYINVEVWWAVTL